MSADLIVVKTGTANLASVLAGLRRAGAEAHLSDDPAEVEAAERLILPGVGAFGAAMSSLTERGLVEPLRKRFEQDRPTLCVCLGLQILAEKSEESPGVAGLGVLPGTEVRRFDNSVRVPQLGWNRMTPPEGSRFLEEGYVYFANSYRLLDAPAGWSAAYADHGGRFVAALERSNVLACQFHPELSGQLGRGILERWLKGAA